MNTETGRPHRFQRALPACLMAVFSIIVLPGCCSLWPRTDPEPMHDPPEIHHPIKAANDIEFRLQTETALIDAPANTVVHIDPAADWEHPLFAPIWQELMPRLLERYPKIDFVTGTRPPDCIYQLTITVVPGEETKLAKLRLRHPLTGKELWSYAHPLYSTSHRSPSP